MTMTKAEIAEYVAQRKQAERLKSSAAS